MISLKKLDNKSFSKIMEDSRREIHRYGEIWTDENYHDPGITILEMLSWLTEMQRFYIDNVSEQSEIELLKILGLDTNPSISKGTVRFHNSSEDRYIPKGTKLIAEEQIFESNRELYVVNNSIESVFTVDKSIRDISRYIDIDDAYFNLFNNNSTKEISEIHPGNSLILLLEKPLARDKLLSIRFDIKDDYKIELSSESNDLGMKYIIHHNPEILNSDAYGDFIKDPFDYVELIEDETLGFKKSGCIFFKLKSEHKQVNIKNKKGYPLIFTVESYYNLLEPQIKKISLNNVGVENKNTICDFKIIEGKRGKLYEEIYSLSPIYVQKKKDDMAWVDYKKFSFNSDIYPYEIEFETSGVFRVLAYDDKQIYSDVIGSGLSIPYQKIRFYMENVLIDKSIISSSRDIKDNLFWFDFAYKANLLNSAADENVFSYDFHEQDLIFGNDEFGSIVEDGQDNIKIIRMKRTDYVRGNIKKATLKSFFNEGIYSGLEFENINDCAGGKDAVSLDSLKKAFVDKINSSKTIITAKDYESAVRLFNDTRVLYSKAIPNSNIENTVDVYAVPFTNTRFYRPTDEFKNSLLKYLEKSKLISSNILVKDAQYVEIKIELKLSIRNRNSFDIEKLKAKLISLYNPTQVNNVNYKYELGTMPSKIDLIKTIKGKYKNAIIENVIINAIGKGVRRSNEGYILPENAVIYCNEVDITLV